MWSAANRLLVRVCLTLIFSACLLAGCRLGRHVGIVPVTPKTDPLGCQQPTEMATLNKGELEVTAQNIGKIATGKISIKDDPQVVSLLSKGAKNVAVIQYYLCVEEAKAARSGRAMTAAEKSYFVRLWQFTCGEPPPTAKEVMEWQEKNPPPLIQAPEQPQPKPLEEVRVSTEGISSPFPEAPYGLALTLQATVPISPIHFVVECDETIHQASFRFSGMASMVVGVRETLAANKYEFYAESPPLTPQRPLIVSLFSRKPIRPRSVTRLY